MKKMLLNYLFVTFIILVTFFLVGLKPEAANFKYSDFNWEELLEQNKDYWISGCDDGDEKCYDRILKLQKGFYERMYKILAHYQDKEDLTIDDKIIIETAFYGITPDSFRDPVDGEDNPYNIGDDEYSNYIGGNFDADGAEDYFKNEKDSLKTLINNMITYKEPCYGISSEKPHIVDGVTTCNGEFYPDGNRCIVLLDDLRTTYYEGLLRKLDILGLFRTDNEKKCQDLGKLYHDYELGKMSKKPVVDEELYWEFLLNSNYFDKKEHLKPYFKSVLKRTNHSSMSELNNNEYEEHKTMIMLSRRSIINNIKSVLESYKPYSSDTSMIAGGKNSYWWPIGSKETSESNGVTFASGNPESVSISSKYGLRTHPVTGKKNSMHNGIDIGGTENVTNIIAVKDGTVVSIIDENGGKCTNGDQSCGGGYGNFVILQHSDGNYTLYAHMANGTLTVKTGDVVLQGQVLGKMGTTGRSTGAHLHFEVRVGGNDTASTQDPLLFIDPNEPRKSGSRGEFEEWIIALEGTVFNGDKYEVHDAEGIGLYRTFGYGIVVEFNKDVIVKHGLDPNSLQYGSLVDVDVADEIWLEVVNQHLDSVKKKLSNKGLSLDEKKINALASLEYNAGNINGFFEAYDKYGATQALCNNYWNKKSTKGYDGLPKRRRAECELFVSGTYNMKPYG